MNLANCKIENVPLLGGNNTKNLNDSVNLNILPSHVKLVIKPIQDNATDAGYYAVRAENFTIGSIYRTIAPMLMSLGAGLWPSVDDFLVVDLDNLNPRFKEFSHKIDDCSTFGKTTDPSSPSNYAATYSSSLVPIQTQWIN